MTVILPADWEQFVMEKVGNGDYPSAAEVVCEALLLLRQRDAEQEKLESLRREIDLGIRDEQQGKLSPFDPMAILDRVRASKRVETQGDV
jgi:putative addiction module CopG family antidote